MQIESHKHILTVAISGDNVLVVRQTIHVLQDENGVPDMARVAVFEKNIVVEWTDFKENPNDPHNG